MGAYHAAGGVMPETVQVRHGVCDSSSTANAKVVTTVDGRPPEPNDLFIIAYTNGNNANSPALHVNGAPGYPVLIGGQNSTSLNSSCPVTASNGGQLIYYFDGSSFIAFGITRTPPSMTAGDLPSGTGIRVITGAFAQYLMDEAVSDSKVYAESLVPKVFSAIGTAETIVDGTYVDVCTLNIPAQPLDGAVVVQTFTRLVKTVTNDVFTARLRHGTSALGEVWPLDVGPNQQTIVMNGAFPLAASTARTVTVQINRASGTGEGTTDGSLSLNHIDAVWYPRP